MKVSFCSDLHTDFHFKEANPQDPKFKKKVGLFIDKYFPDDLGDVLIIAGDTSHYNQQIRELLEQLKEKVKDIVVVSGNHDYYMISDNIRKQFEWSSQQRVDQIQEICDSIDGVHYLDGDIVTIDGIRFGGTGGWYNLPTPKDIKHWKQALNDSNLIFDGYPVAGAYSYGYRGNPDWDTQQHYLDELQKLANVAKEGCDVLVTHIAQVVAPDEEMPMMYRGDPSNIFYWVANKEIVKESGAKYYVFGHTHDPYRFKLDNCLCLCNPLGYSGENPGFKMNYFEV